MRKIYTLIFYLALPAILFRLYWRGRKAPEYRLRWPERLGYYRSPATREVIWFHAVSVGEAEAAFALIKLLQSRYPEQTFLVTSTTPTGSARIKAVLGDSVQHVYLPYDLPDVLQRFFRHFQPKLAVIMEKEIWPNLYADCAARQIPLFIINARLSAGSARAYHKIPGLIKPALACIRQIATQTADDRTRFIEIGASEEQVKVQGNIKFDLEIDAATVRAGETLKQQQFTGRFVWIIASTHPGEEEIFLRLYPALKLRIPSLLLLLVPRHPERFQTVKKLCQDQHLQVIMRSEQRPVTEDCDVYLADSMGELKMLYAASDIAFVAGSMASIGGHNVLEPAAIRLPVLFGPQMFNFQEIAEQMLAANAAVQCADESAISAALVRLYEDAGYRQTLAANAREFVGRNQGATERIAMLLQDYF